MESFHKSPVVAVGDVDLGLAVCIKNDCSAIFFGQLWEPCRVDQGFTKARLTIRGFDEEWQRLFLLIELVGAVTTAEADLHLSVDEIYDVQGSIWGNKSQGFVQRKPIHFASQDRPVPRWCAEPTAGAVMRLRDSQAR